MRPNLQTTVGQVCDEFGGSVQTGPFGSQLHASDYSESGTPVVMPQDMVDGLIVCDRIARIPDDAVRGLERHQMRVGDIVFSRRGDVSRFAVVTEREQGWLCGTGSIRIRLNCPQIDTRYLRRFLQQDAVGDWLRHNAKGVTMANLNTEIIRAIPLVLPPLAEQRRIAAILDQADDLRRKRRAVLERLEHLHEALYRHVFEKNGRRFDSIELRGAVVIDDDIKCGPFGTQLQQSEFAHAGVPLWGIKHVNARFRLMTHEFLKPAKARTLSGYDIRPGDLVMTRKGTVGNCAIYPAQLPAGIMHSDLLRLRLNGNKFASVFVADQFHFSHELTRQLAVISGGAVMPGINVGRLKSLKIIAPSVQSQQDYAARVAEIEMLKSAHRAHLEKLNTLFAALQHRAFRGELAGASAARNLELA